MTINRKLSLLRLHYKKDLKLLKNKFENLKKFESKEIKNIQKGYSGHTFYHNNKIPTVLLI